MRIIHSLVESCVDFSISYLPDYRNFVVDKIKLKIITVSTAIFTLGILAPNVYRKGKEWIKKKHRSPLYIGYGWKNRPKKIKHYNIVPLSRCNIAKFILNPSHPSLSKKDKILAHIVSGLMKVFTLGVAHDLLDDFKKWNKADKLIQQLCAGQGSSLNKIKRVFASELISFVELKYECFIELNDGFVAYAYIDPTILDKIASIKPISMGEVPEELENALEFRRGIFIYH